MFIVCAASCLTQSSKNLNKSPQPSQHNHRNSSIAENNKQVSQESPVQQHTDYVGDQTWTDRQNRME